MLGPGVIIYSREHGIDLNDSIRNQPKISEKIIIGDDVWIAAGAIILKGIKIGKGAVVSAGSIVNRDVPKNAIVAGNPARIIKYRE